jgi:hypothetical protein
MDDTSFAIPKALKSTKKSDIQCSTEPKKENDISKGSVDTSVGGKNEPAPEETSLQNMTTGTSDSDKNQKEFKALIASVPSLGSKPSEPQKIEDNVRKEPEVAVLQYKEPKWSGPASFPYTVEVLKGGRILEEVSYFTTITLGLTYFRNCQNFGVDVFCTVDTLCICTEE